MRFLVRISFPTEAGNDAARQGFPMIPAILEEQKPEAVYFYAENGLRTAMMIINMDHASELPRIAEPWFLALSAEVDAFPVMTPEDLKKAEPDIKAAVKKYG
jgi:hypothetical protein